MRFPLHLSLFLATLGAASLSAQSPDLYDTEVVRDIKLTFKQSNWWQQLLNNYSSKTDISADMVVDGKSYPNVGVRFRGNTSYKRLPPNSEKRSLNIVTDAFVPGQSLYGYEHLNLNNGFHDPTFMREFLLYMICRRYGPAPKANFVRVTLNGQYWGIYINVQQPNKDMLKEWFRDEDGNRYRGAPPAGGSPHGNSALIWLGSSPSSYTRAYDFKQGDGTDLVNLCNVLNNTPLNQLQAALPKVWSVDQGFRYCIIMNMFLQTDSYIGSGKDHFEYHDPYHDIFHIFPFDLNEALGGEGRADPRTSPWYNTTNAQKPAIGRTLGFADWRARYTAHYRTILEESFSWNELGGLITKYQNMIRADVARDTKKLYTTQQFTSNVTQDVGGGNRPIKGLRPLIQARESYLKGLSEFNTARASLSGLGHWPTNPLSKDTVWVTVKAGNATKVTLYQRRQGPFASSQMYDDGQHGDGKANDGVYGASVAPQAAGSIIDYYVEATASSGAVRFLPKTAEFQSGQYRVEWPWGNSPIKINEILAKNVNGIKDSNGEHEDWIELYNASGQTVSVSGMHLSDNFTNSTKWQIPAGQNIPAWSTTLIWCDEDGKQGAMHASFKLSSQGEEIGLFASDGKTLLDALAFGVQQPDVSTGRYFDGGTPWVSFPDPSPRNRNEVFGCATRAYSALDSTLHAMSLTLTGAPKIGTSMTMNLSGGPKSGSAHVFMAPGPGHQMLGLNPDVAVLLDLSQVVGPVPLVLNGQGGLNVPLAIPNIPSAVGKRVCMQAFAIDAARLTASNGAEAMICR